MGNLQARQTGNRIFKPGHNVERVYRLVSGQLTSITEELEDFYYHDLSEERMIRRIGIIFIQLDSVYFRDSPKYEDFLPSPPYSKEDDVKPLKLQEKQEIFYTYLEECVKHMNTFCNEYCILTNYS
jgi:hypothetical protein